MPESAVIFRHFAKMLRGEFKTLDACFARQHQRCIVKAASFDVFLSTNSDGTLQVDNACIEANYEIIHESRPVRANGLQNSNNTAAGKKSSSPRHREQVCVEPNEFAQCSHGMGPVREREDPPCAQFSHSAVCQKQDIQTSQIEHPQGHLLDTARQRHGQPEEPVPHSEP